MKIRQFLTFPPKTLNGGDLKMTVIIEIKALQAVGKFACKLYFSYCVDDSKMMRLKSVDPVYFFFFKTAFRDSDITGR